MHYGILVVTQNTIGADWLEQWFVVVHYVNTEGVLCTVSLCHMNKRPEAIQFAFDWCLKHNVCLHPKQVLELSNE